MPEYCFIPDEGIRGPIYPHLKFTKMPDIVLDASAGELTIFESSGTAAPAPAPAYKWKSKQSSSGSKTAWNTSGEKETGGEGGSGGEEFSGETGHFARKCSLGGNSKSGGSGVYGGGNMGKAPLPA